jgi:hypothetical protein
LRRDTKQRAMRFVSAVAFALAALLLSTTGAQADDTYAPLIGNWTCSSDLGSVVTQTYTLSSDGRWLHMLASWNNTKYNSAGYFDNNFYRDAKGWWNTESHGANGWSWAGRSDGWKNDALVFDGVEETATGPFITRETLTRSSDGKLEHKWEMKNGEGAYVVTSRAMCTKDPAPEPQ